MLLIVDAPRPQDLRIAGTGFLNLAADQVFALYDQLDNAQFADELFAEERDDYWQAAQQPLASALALVQQGAEFLLKARIADVSPYLLIASDVRSWPSPGRDVRFNEFRTVNPQDLICLHDIVCNEHLSPQFRQQFDELRTRRNIVMHGVDHAFEVEASSVLVAALEVTQELYRPGGWMARRRLYLDGTPTSAAYSADHVEVTLIAEGLRLLDLLPPAKVRRYFDFNVRQRRYLCPTCHFEGLSADLEARTAFLRPNRPEATHIHCFVCVSTYDVRRSQCANDACAGNVIDEESDMCLTCYSEQ